ncbi:hypothetical protein B0G73_10112 [Paraburkholderia sp. BL25I1N1]|nr:hypothetical protein B0G73_10112 [Paraburkholderia sp. BL25I1N1]
MWRGRAQTMLTWLAAAGMTFVYLSWPIGASNVFGVTAIAFGTAAFMLAAHRTDGTANPRTHGSAVLEAFARLSSEGHMVSVNHILRGG